jgi:hypothetical protein
MKPSVAILLGLGLAQMTGSVLGISALKGLAAATAASPAPKVFSAVDGLETYSTKFYLEWTDVAGEDRSLHLSPELYSRLEGTYNRRNTYGAALAYAPVFVEGERTRDMLISIARYGLCGEAPLLREFGMDPDQIQGPVRVRLELLEGTDPGDLMTEFVAPCE